QPQDHLIPKAVEQCVGSFDLCVETPTPEPIDADAEDLARACFSMDHSGDHVATRPGKSGGEWLLVDDCPCSNEFGDLVRIISFRCQHSEWCDRLTLTSHLEADVFRHGVSPRHRFQIVVRRLFAEGPAAAEDDGAATGF